MIISTADIIIIPGAPGDPEPCTDLAAWTTLDAVESTDLALFNPNSASA